MSQSNRGPRIARILRGRTIAANADEYHRYLLETGFAPLVAKTKGALMFREDRTGETELVTITYRDSVEAMSAFAGKDPRKIHHLPRDEEYLIELPDGVQILDTVAGEGVVLSQGTIDDDAE